MGKAIWGKAKTGLTELKTATRLVSGIANDLGSISFQFSRIGGVGIALFWYLTVIKILSQLFRRYRPKLAQFPVICRNGLAI